MFSWRPSTILKLCLLRYPCVECSTVGVRRWRGEMHWILPLREWLWTGRPRATGSESARLFLCSGSVCQSCIKFHMEKQGNSLGEHSTAGKQAVRKSTIIQTRAQTKDGLQMCWLGLVNFPCIQSIPLEGIYRNKKRNRSFVQFGMETYILIYERWNVVSILREWEVLYSLVVTEELTFECLTIGIHAGDVNSYWWHLECIHPAII